MVRIGFLLCAVLISQVGFAANDTLIIPGKRVGPITPSTKRDNLEKLYGKSNLKDEILYEAEGTVETPITKITKKGFEATICWADESRTKIARIYLENDQSKWHTKDGIHVGTSLEELEKANGKPISFNGFGWDYGGFIKSWNGGKLENGGLGVVLKQTAFHIEGEEKFIGDGAEPKSNDPLVPKLKVVVASVNIAFIPL